MRRFFLYLTAVMLTAIMWSCKDTDPKMPEIQGVGKVASVSGDGYSVKYQYADGVIVLTPSLYADVIKVMEDSILFINEDSELSKKLEIGSILASPSYPGLPYGLGNKVIGLSNNGIGLRVVTSVSPLDEVFQDLRLEASIPMLQEIPKNIETTDGCEVEVGKVAIKDLDTGEDVRSTRFQFGSPDALSFNLGYNVTGNGAFAQATVYVGCVATLNIDIKGGKFEVSQENFFGVEGTLGVHGSANKKFTKKPIFKTTIATGIVTLGPVVLRPFLDLKVDVEAEAGGEVSTGFKRFASMKVGLNEKGTICEFNKGEDDLRKNVKDLYVNGSLEAYLKGAINLGIGLYTKNIAIALEPYVKVGPSVEMELTNANNWRLNPEFHFKGLMGAEGQMFVRFFGKELLSEHLALAEFSIFDISCPLLPQLDASSLKIEIKKDSPQLMFEGKYHFSPGLLSAFMEIYPGIKVYRSGEELMSRQRGSRIDLLGSGDYEFILSELSHDIAYTGRPYISLMGKAFDTDGTLFSAKSPTAAITEIVQTGSEGGENVELIGPNGKTYHYKFPYYLNVELKGADQCLEWGLYTPNAMFAESIYTPLELKDGRVTSYWTLWSWNSSGSVADQVPYVILNNTTADILYFDGYPKTLYYGGLGAKPAKTPVNNKPQAKTKAEGIKAAKEAGKSADGCYWHLDSVYVHKTHQMIRMQ